MLSPWPRSWMRYPLAGSIAGPLEDSGMSRCLPMRTPSGAIAGMFGYGSPAAPGASSFTAARADATDRQRIATLAMANRFARRPIANGVEVEFFILLLVERFILNCCSG